MGLRRFLHLKNRAAADPAAGPSIIHEGDVVYTLPPTRAPERDSVLFFTVPKAGTVLLNKIIYSLARTVGLQHIYLEGELFRHGINGEFTGGSPRLEFTGPFFLPKGYCYGSQILPETYGIPIVGKVKTILLVRDPRDMLVSFYYSVRESHPTPGKAEAVISQDRQFAQSASVDTFVLHLAERYARVLRRYHECLAQSPLTKVFRYEDVIYLKAQWIADVCSHYGWDIPEKQRQNIVAEVDLFPEQERTDQHTRQVHPGNYKKKLMTQTINSLDTMLREEMALFGYATDVKDFD